MNLIHRHIRVERTARYFLFDAGTGGTEGRIWLVLHGYGERADEFLTRIGPILGGKSGQVLAPEGLSRFYTRGGNGEIGASWMTSLARESEIAEYLAMIEQVMEVEDIPPDRNINVFGFSQGAATAMRVALRSGRRIERLVLWGAGFEESELRNYPHQLGSISEVIVVHGETDRIVPPRVSEATVKVLEKLGARVRRLSHPGGHTLDDRVLALLSEMPV